MKRIFISPGVFTRLNGLQVPSEDRLKWVVTEFLNCRLNENHGYRRFVIPPDPYDTASCWFIYLADEEFNESLLETFRYLGSFHRPSRDLIRLYNTRNAYQETMIYNA